MTRHQLCRWPHPTTLATLATALVTRHGRTSVDTFDRSLSHRCCNKPGSPRGWESIRYACCGVVAEGSYQTPAQFESTYAGQKYDFGAPGIRSPPHGASLRPQRFKNLSNGEGTYGNLKNGRLMEIENVNHVLGGKSRRRIQSRSGRPKQNTAPC